MGLFKKKQVDLNNRSMTSSNLPSFPRYPEGSEEPREIRPRPMPSLPPLPKISMPIEEEPEEEPSFEEPKEEPGYRVPEFEEFQTPIRRPLKPMLGESIMKPKMFSEHVTNDSKPIFVKLEKYRSAINNINELKRKIREAEELIEEIEKIKSQEDREFSNWQKHISDIKARLLEIDRNLFEV